MMSMARLSLTESAVVKTLSRQKRARVSDLRGSFTVLSAICICILYALLVGNRDLDVGTDTVIYADMYQLAIDCQCVPPARGLEYGFAGLTAASFRLRLSTSEYFTFLALVQGLAWFLTVSIMAKTFGIFARSYTALLLFSSLLLLLSPFFVATSVNVIRAGIAIPLALSAGFLLFRNQWVFAALLAVASVSFQTLNGLTVIGAFVVARSVSIYLIAALAFILSLLYPFGVLSGLADSIMFFGDYLLGYGFKEVIDVLESFRYGVRTDLLASSWLGLAALSLLFRICRCNFLVLKRAQLANLLPFLVLGTLPFSDRFLLGFWLLLTLSVSVAVTTLMRRLNLTDQFVLVLVFVAIPVIVYSLDRKVFG